MLDPNATFVSLVGTQPGSIAVALGSWRQRFGDFPQRTILLATAGPRGTLAIADRLKAMFPRCEVHPTSSSLADEGELHSPTTVVGNLGLELPLAYYVDPGLNFQAAALARALPQETVLLSSDSEQLHLLGTESHDVAPSCDIGLDALFQLHGIAAGFGGDTAPIVETLLGSAGPPIAGLKTGLRVNGAGTLLDAVFERRGRLIGLAVVVGGPNSTQRCRLLRSLRFGDLIPQVTVVTNSEQVVTRCRAEGLRSIFIGGLNARGWTPSREDRQRIQAWVDGKTAAPGRVTAQRVPPAPPPPVQRRDFGAGGTGPALAVFLGPNVTPTLVSLCTHRPRTAYIFYDTDTPVIHQFAQRLAREVQLGNLPVGEAHFLPSDRFGTGIAAGLRAIESTNPGLRIDITPGTKPSACALARAGAGDLYSQVTRAGEARRLDEDTGIKLAAAPLDVLARVFGGDCHGGKPVRKQREFWLALAKHLASLPGPGAPELMSDPRTWPGVTLERSALGQSLVLSAGGRQLRAHGSLPRMPGGAWLEWMVAHVLAAAGADEVTLNMTWDWPDGARPGAGRQPFEAEVDVLARFDTSIVAVSCKTARDENAGRACDDISSTASSHLGRMALPVYVHPAITDAEVEATSSERGNVLRLGLNALADPCATRKAIDKAFASRRTTMAES